MKHEHLFRESQSRVFEPALPFGRPAFRLSIMKKPSKFAIDLSEKFATLPNAPIVEAVIHWHALPTKTIPHVELQHELARRFPEYEVALQQSLEAGFKESPSGMEMSQRSVWDGFRLTSKDKKYICQWKLNSIAVSRLAPYEQWDKFYAVATPFWQAYQEITLPSLVERLGVRFISQIVLKGNERISGYVQKVPIPLKGLGLRSESFLHQDKIPITGYPYEVRLVRALQPPQPPMSLDTSLIVDIDVSTTEATTLDILELRIQEMRFLKNKVFFTFMKDAEKKFG